jgi:hypothetical protein
LLEKRYDYKGKIVGYLSLWPVGYKFIFQRIKSKGALRNRKKK